MNHDPLCPWMQPCPGSYEGKPHEFVPLDGTSPDYIVCYNCTSTDCQCRLIRKVREDAFRSGYEAAMEDGWGEPGHVRAALDAAMQRVRDYLSLPPAWEHPEHPEMQDIDKAKAIAAIDALRGESNG